MQPLRDKSPAAWIERQVLPGVRGTAHLFSLMPKHFEAYARVLHPAYQPASDTPARWVKVAGDAGTILHASANFEKLVGARRASWDDPNVGQLPLTETQELTRILNRFTKSKDGYFLIWEGYAGMAAFIKDAAQISLPRRVYGLFGGPLDAVIELHQGYSPVDSPNIWWTQDRAWCCATDIDLESTYVGGSIACIADVLASGLETFAVASDARIDGGSDTINPEVPR